MSAQQHVQEEQHKPCRKCGGFGPALSNNWCDQCGPAPTPQTIPARCEHLFGNDRCVRCLKTFREIIRAAERDRDAALERVRELEEENIRYKCALEKEGKTFIKKPDTSDFGNTRI